MVELLLACQAGGDPTSPDSTAEVHDSAVGWVDTAADTAPGDTSTDPDSGEDTAVGDVDGDGFPLGEDCDDSDPLVYPGAEEVCGDGRDNDCAGAGELCHRVGDHSTADADGVLRGAGANEEVGDRDQMILLPDLDGDDDDELVVGVFTDIDAGAVGGLLVSLGGRTGDLPRDIEFVSDRPWQHGYKLDWGDLDGDGLAEVRTYLDGGPDGSPYATGFVYMPSSTGTVDLEDWLHVIVADYDNPLNEPGFVWRNTGLANDVLGGAGWSFQDLAYPALGLFLSPAVTAEWRDADRWVWGTEAWREVGGATDLGDLDGDGIDSLGVVVYGIPGSSGELTGAVAVFDQLPTDGSTLEDADRVVWGDGAHHDSSALLLRPGGDATGDGIGDVLLTYQDEDIDGVNDAGCARVVTGPLPVESSIMSSSTAICGQDPYDGAGRDATMLSDFDGDGRADVALGEVETGTVAQGVVRVFYAPLPAGVVSSDHADWSVFGAADMEMASVPTSGGDFDGDGTDDLVVGAYNNSEVAIAAGAAYLFRGWGE